MISPIFIGFLIAWLFEPLVTKMQKRKMPRVLACIIVYAAIIGLLFLIVYLFIPSLISEVKDFVKVAPDIYDDLSNFALNIILRKYSSIKERINKMVIRFWNVNSI